MSLLQDLDYIRSQLGNLQAGLGVTNTTIITTIVPGAKYQYYSSLAGQPSQTLAPDLSQGYNVEVVLDTSSGVMGTPSNIPAAGSVVLYLFKQDGTGYRTISSWAAVFKGVSHFAPRQGPNQYSSVTFVSDGTNLNVFAIDGIDTTQPLNARDFGAVGDGTTDDTVALRAWATTELNSSNSIDNLYDRDLYLPHGTYVLGKPLVFSNRTRLRGDGRSQSVFTHNGYPWVGGPAIYIGEDSNTNQHRITTAAALLTGVGYSMRLDNTAPQWLNLRNSNCVEIDTSTAFTAEFTIKVDPADTASNGGLVDILGCKRTDYSLSPIANELGAFVFQLFRVDATHYYIQTALRTATSGLQVVSTGTQRFGPGVDVHVALTYDGAHAQLWINGVQDASVAMTGGIVQSALECIDLNGGVIAYPALPGNSPSMQGWIDSIRFSNSVRYTTGFTPPTAKFVRDGNTLLLINFDNFDGPAVLGSSIYGSGAPVYMITRPTAANSFSAGNDFTDFGVLFSQYHDAILINGCTNLKLKGIEISGCQNGIEVIGQTFSAVEYDHLLVTVSGVSGSAFCFNSATTGATGFSRLSNCVFTGGAAAVLCAGGFELDNVNITPNSAGQYGIVARGSSGFACLAIRSSGIDYETNGGFIAPLVLQAMGSVTLDNVQLDSAASTYGTPASIIVEGTSGWNARVSCRDVFFNVPSGGTWIKQNTAKPLASILMENWNQASGANYTVSNYMGNVRMLGAEGLQRSTVANANYTVVPTDRRVVCTSIAGALVWTLPTAASCPGLQIEAKDESGGCSGVNTITVQVSGGANIDGAAMKVLNSAYAIARFYSNGTQWFTE